MRSILSTPVPLSSSMIRCISTTMCVNYTTYDVQCTQDVINSTNSYHNIMLLNDSNPDTRLTNKAEFSRYTCTLDMFMSMSWDWNFWLKEQQTGLTLLPTHYPA